MPADSSAQDQNFQVRVVPARILGRPDPVGELVGEMVPVRVQRGQIVMAALLQQHLHAPAHGLELALVPSAPGEPDLETTGQDFAHVSAVAFAVHAQTDGVGTFDLADAGIDRVRQQVVTHLPIHPGWKVNGNDDAGR